MMPRVCNIVEFAFLSSRLQLCSFALHEDILFSVDVIGIIYQAEQDAMRLIQIAEKNLSLVPFYACRSVCYAALILLKLLKYSCVTQHEHIWDHIERARLALGATAKTDGDVHQGIDRLLQAATFLQEKKANPPTQFRMTFSVVFNILRAYQEQFYESPNATLCFVDEDNNPPVELI